MRLLIVTQIVDKDDSVLGFFHRWIEEFAKHCEEVIVICLKEGTHTLPKNVRVLSLGKEEDASRMKYLKRFYAYVWRERENYDNVFVHMNPEYVVLAGLLWRALGKKVGLWYTHRQVTSTLRLALMLSDAIFTASQESFGLLSSKVHVTGHGIDTKRYKQRKHDKVDDGLRIVSVGRISGIKRLETVVHAIAQLKKSGLAPQSEFVGAVLTDEDEQYRKKILNDIRTLKLDQEVSLSGGCSSEEVIDKYHMAAMSINAAPTGGLDKAVLESLAAGTPAFVCNNTFTSLYGTHAAMFIFTEGSSSDLADKIVGYLKLPPEQRKEIADALQKHVCKMTDIRHLVDKILIILGSQNPR